MRVPRPTALPLVPEGAAPDDRSRSATGAGPEEGAPVGRGQVRPIRPDLPGDADLRRVLEAFYASLGQDPLLAPYFATLDVDAHLPRIADFWSTLLFHTSRYDGNVFRPHLAMPGLTAHHFARWLAALDATVRASHAGPTADRMLDLAHRIAYSVQLRLGVTPHGPADPQVGDPQVGDAPAGPGGPPC